MATLYGYSAADVTQDALGNVEPGKTCTVFTAFVGGNAYTQTYAVGPALSQGSSTGGIVSANDKGRVVFFADATQTLWLDWGDGTRWPINPIELDKVLTAKVDVLADSIDGKIDTALGTRLDGFDGRLQAVAVTPQQFGAVGDGVTNDTAAFEAALVALGEAGGGTLMVPPRTYVLATTAAIVLNVDKITVEAYGATFTRFEDATRAMFVSNTRGTPDYGSGVRSLHWRGGRFLGDLGAQRYISPFALHHAQDVSFEDVTFEGCEAGGSHIFDMGGCDKVRIRRCTFLGTEDRGDDSNVSEAIQLDASYKNTLTGGTLDAGFSGLFTRDVVVEDCKFLPYVDAHGVLWPAPTPMGAHFVVEGKYYEHVRFVNNYVQDPRQCPIPENSNDSSFTYQRGVVHFPCVKHLTVERNEFVMTVANRPTRVITVHGKGSGVLASNDPGTDTKASGTWAVPSAPADIVIRDNTITGFGLGVTGTEQEVIVVRGVDGGNGAITGVTVNGNRIYDSYSPSAATHAKTIWLDNVTGGDASDNRVVNCYEGVRVERSSDVTVRGNKLRTAHNKPLHVVNSAVVAVTGNTVNGYGSTCHIESGAYDVTFTGNVITTPIDGFLGQALTLTGDVQRALATGNTINGTAAATVGAVSVNSGLVDSVVTGNLIRGYTTKVSGTAGSGTTLTGNF